MSFLAGCAWDGTAPSGTDGLQLPDPALATAPACAGIPSGTTSLIMVPNTQLTLGINTSFDYNVTNQASVTVPDCALTWSTSNSKIATVGTTGIVTGKALGGPISIAAQTKTKPILKVSVLVSVGSSISTLSISPASATISAGGTQALTAIPKDSKGTILTGRAVTWTTSDATVASVSTTGLVTATAYNGSQTRTATITATSEGKTATATITVTPTAITTLTVSPATATIAVGGTQQVTASATDANGNSLTGRTVAWTSSDTAVASVSTTGLVTATAYAGSQTRTATITATSEGKTATATITVTPTVITTLTVSPATATIAVGGTLQVTAIATDINGNSLTGRPVTWTSSDATVASVSTFGLVTATAYAGSQTRTATITATSEGKTGTATVSVTPSPVATITISPANSVLDVGQSLQLVATLRDANGTILVDRSIGWQSSDSQKATVSGSGLVAGIAIGRANITASSEGKTAVFITAITQRSSMLTVEGADDTGSWRSSLVRIFQDSVVSVPEGSISRPTAIQGLAFSMYGRYFSSRTEILAGVNCFPCQQIAKIPLDASLPATIVIAPGGHGNLEETISSDDSRITWARQESYGPGGRIWIANADGSSPVQLTVDPVHDKAPSFSPAQDFIVWTRRSGFIGTDLPVNIWRMAPTGANQVQLTNSNVDELASVSPNGQRIAFFSKRSGSWSLWTMNSDGSGPLEVTGTAQFVPQAWNHFGDGNRIRPIWSPDGRFIAFTGEVSGALSVYVVPADGTRAPRKLFSTIGNNRLADWR
jgi:uncharacterized protein YjdB